MLKFIVYFCSVILRNIKQQAILQKFLMKKKICFMLARKSYKAYQKMLVNLLNFKFYFLIFFL